jgi:hypothetical protein
MLAMLNIYVIKKNTEALLEAVREDGVEVNVSPEYRVKS